MRLTDGAASALLLVSCAGEADVVATSPETRTDRPLDVPQTTPVRAVAEVTPPPEALTRIGAEAMQVPRVNTTAYFAPGLCSQPTPTDAVGVSRAGPESTHARKLFYVRARDMNQYVAIAEGKTPAPESGFFVVKESYATDDRHQQGPPAGLFIAWRESGAWRFGTISPEGVASTQGEKTCAGCHASQTKTGLFGLVGKPVLAP